MWFDILNILCFKYSNFGDGVSGQLFPYVGGDLEKTIINRLLWYCLKIQGLHGNPAWAYKLGLDS